MKLNGVTAWEASWYGDAPNLRGVNVVIVDPFSCSVQGEALRYDTYGNRNVAADLAASLQGLSSGSIVVGISADEATRYLDAAEATLTGIGADVSDVGHRGAFAFVAQKGFSAKTVLRKALTEAAANAEQPHFTATVSGAIYCTYPSTNDRCRLRRRFRRSTFLIF